MADDRHASGNSYEGFAVSDQATVLAGNINVHMSSEDDRGMSPSDRRRIILTSLYFEGIDNFDTRRPLNSHPGTFNWLFDQDRRPDIPQHLIECPPDASEIELPRVASALASIDSRFLPPTEPHPLEDESCWEEYLSRGDHLSADDSGEGDLSWGDHLSDDDSGEGDLSASHSFLTIGHGEREKHALKLRRWLESSDDLFWVHGKAGSGKSTFMKFLLEHESTMQSLRKWSNGEEVLVAAFFFWQAGSELEKSQLGLLRGLLYTILHRQPDLIEKAAPERWESLSRSATMCKPWNIKELDKALSLVLQSFPAKARFCFFVDGLDEFGGEHSNLICTLEKLGKSPAVKLCVSSRPWNPFKMAYGLNESHQLALHELTTHDIELFTAMKLEENNRRQRLNGKEIRDLVSHVCDRANGVFLWVTLAVRDLIRGMSEYEGLSSLKARLARYPTELHSLFDHIFERIESDHQIFTGRLLLMMSMFGRYAKYAVGRNLQFPLICAAFLEGDCEVGDQDQNPQWSPKSSDDMRALLDRASACANKWCRDLLEPIDAKMITPRNGLISHFGPPLAFSHQTMYDFIRKKEAHGKLTLLVGESFRPQIAFVRLLVLLAKTVQDFQSFLQVFDAAVEVMMLEYYSFTSDDSFRGHTIVTSSLESDSFSILEDFGRLCDQILVLDQIGNQIIYGENNPNDQAYAHWAADSKDHLSHLCLVNFQSCYTVIAYLMCCGASPIVLELLDRHVCTMSDDQRQFMLEFALMPEIYPGTAPPRAGFSHHGPGLVGHPDMACNVIVKIIESGIELNKPSLRHGSADHSVWQYFLVCLGAAHGRRGGSVYAWWSEIKSETFASLRPAHIFMIFKTFLQYGADPFTTIRGIDLLRSRDCEQGRDGDQRFVVWGCCAVESLRVLTVADVLELLDPTVGMLAIARIWGESKWEETLMLMKAALAQASESHNKSYDLGDV